MRREPGFLGSPRRGRPRGATMTVPTSVRLPAPLYDAACHRARVDRVSLPEVIRRALQQHVPASARDSAAE